MRKTLQLPSFEDPNTLLLTFYGRMRLIFFCLMSQARSQEPESPIIPYVMAKQPPPHQFPQGKSTVFCQIPDSTIQTHPHHPHTHMPLPQHCPAPHARSTDPSQWRRPPRRDARTPPARENVRRHSRAGWTSRGGRESQGPMDRGGYKGCSIDTSMVRLGGLFVLSISLAGPPRVSLNKVYTTNRHPPLTLPFTLGKTLTDTQGWL